MREKIQLWLLPLLFKAMLMLIGSTCKIRWQNRAVFEQLHNAKQAYILSFWHENVLIIPWLLRNRDITCMVSDSRDGEYIARAGEVFGNKVMRGSSSKGSTKATRAALRLLKNQQSIAITPDGPRGPVHKLQSGVLWLSALGSVPILPLHIEVDRQWRFKSWDGQKIPKPFSTIYVSVPHQPTQISRDELGENQTQVINSFELKMMENTNVARQRAGYSSLPL